MSSAGEGKRPRADSVGLNLMSDQHSLKRLKTGGDSTWAKIDNMIAKPECKLVLFEVPKGVRITA